MTGHKRIYRAGSLLLAALVTTLTLAVMVHATQTITTPNATLISYNLPAGANSSAIFPPASQSVLLMGVQNNSGFRGVGHVSLLRVPGNFLEWVGLESPPVATITSGFSGAFGTHIVYIGWNKSVDVQVNSSDTFIIHNANSIAMAGNVTMVW
jgi:hypothetical protein